MQRSAFSPILLCISLIGCTPLGSRQDSTQKIEAGAEEEYRHLIGRTFYCDGSPPVCPPCIIKSTAGYYSGHVFFLHGFTIKGLVSYKGVPHFEAYNKTSEMLIRADEINENRLYKFDERTRERMAKEAKQKADQDKAEQHIPNVLAVLASLNIKSGDLLYTKERADGVPGLSKVIFRTVKITPETYLKLDQTPVHIVLELPSGKLTERVLAYSLSNFANPKSIEQAIEHMFYRKLPRWSASIMKDIEQGSVVIGMTEEQVAASIGWPKDSNRSSGPWGSHDQWIYGDGKYRSYIYLRNGRVSSWQN
jgi:hypothetical protein